jgi:hypothetical protein
MMDDIILNTSEIQTELQEEKEIKLKQETKKTIYSEFNEWLSNNLIYKERATLTLHDVCESFFGEKIASRISTNYKKEIENYIKKEFKNVTYKYTRYTKYRGWKNIALKEQIKND